MTNIHECTRIYVGELISSVSLKKTSKKLIKCPKFKSFKNALKLNGNDWTVVSSIFNKIIGYFESVSKVFRVSLKKELGF